MQRHIKRVGGGLVAAIVFGSVLLMTDIPKALEQADRSFAFLGSSLGISNPPPHFVSDAWHHPWVVLLAFFFVFAVGVLLFLGDRGGMGRIVGQIAARLGNSSATYTDGPIFQRGDAGH